MKIKVGISNRHVHLTEEDCNILFKEELTYVSDLNQPDNFISNNFVDLVTEKNIIKKVRVLGKTRNYTQVEISKTDSRILGLNPPIRESGNLENSELIKIVGPKGEVTGNFCILADRHIHITNELKEKYNLPNTVKIKVNTEKGGILDEVHLKISENAYYELHLDTDDANAFLLNQDDEVELVI